MRPRPDAHPLARARAKAGLTQRELARRAGTTARTVSAIERGVYHGRWSTVSRFAAVLDADPRELVPDRDF
jgi:transcriptional regulator with XRE-family HTH domain